MKIDRVQVGQVVVDTDGEQGVVKEINYRDKMILVAFKTPNGLHEVMDEVDPGDLEIAPAKEEK